VWLLVGVGFALPAHAQHALRATRIESRNLPEPLLTLRPQAGLRRLAEEVAAVLELRTGQRVEVGDPPPPGLLEAVPAGHVAMARQAHAVVLVLGASGGRSFDATVTLSSPEGAADARAVALAAESLRDTATEMARASDSEVAPDATAVPVQPDLPRTTAEQPERAHPTYALVDAAAAGHGSSGDSFLGSIEPLLYLRMYGGASTASTSAMGGVGTGLGLCVRRHCLFVAGEVPVNTGSTEHLDVRYRYPTFLSGFYTRPFSFGRFTPGASVGFLTRLGHFEADMGMNNRTLSTDLGARGGLELAYELVPGLDLMTEGGVDLTLDRHRMSTGVALRDRGDRWSPWLQGALRYRP
jgi:hypothetical protein